MAANFWLSSQFTRWTYSKIEVTAYREKLLQAHKFDQELLLPHYIFLIQAVGKRLDFHQIVIATAVTFFRRFYLKESIFEYDPKFVAPTVLYLAAKVEELGQILPSVVLNGFEREKELLKLVRIGIKPVDVFGCEISILEKLKFDLVVFHPYQDLERYTLDNRDRYGQDTAALFQTAWTVLNDSQRSCVMLIYPPCIIALSALYLACVHMKREKDCKPWFDELNVNLDEIRECTEDIIASSRADEERAVKLKQAMVLLDERT
jgi:cyclin C